MRRRELAAAVVTAAAAVATAWLPGKASAAEPVPSAWWRVLRQTTPVGALPAAPVPNNGSLPVQNGPAGVLAFSAVRFEAGDSSAATLTLSYAGQAPAVPPVIDLCPARTHWTVGPDQEWDARPSYDCTTHASSTTDGTKVVWQVSSGLIRDGELDVVLVPDAGDATPYAVSFAAPTRESLVLAPGLPSPQLPPAVPPPAGSSGTSSAASGAGSAALAGTSAAAPIVEPSAAAAPVVAPASAAAAPGFAPETAPVADARPAGSRTLGAAMLAGIAVVLMLRGFTGGRPHGGGRSLLDRTGQES